MFIEYGSHLLQRYKAESVSGVSKPTTLVLIIAIFASALLVVYSKHRQRLLFADYQQLQIRLDSVETQWGRLLLEEATLGDLNRVESISTTELEMGVPSPGHVMRVDR